MRISLKKIWKNFTMPRKEHYKSVDEFKASNNKHIDSANEFVHKLKVARSQGLGELAVKSLYAKALKELPEVASL